MSPPWYILAKERKVKLKVKLKPRKIMKKLLSILFAMLLFVALPSCDKGDEPNPSNDPTVTDDGGGTTVEPEITKTIHFVLTHEDSWDNPYALDGPKTASIYYGTDSLNVEQRLESMRDQMDGVEGFSILNQADDAYQTPCSFTNSASYRSKNSSNTRETDITAKAGEKIFIISYTHEWGPGGTSIVTATHRAYFTIDDLGLSTVFNYSGFLAHCENTIGIQY